MILARRQEASKSLVIQVSSEKSYQELVNYASQFGTVKRAFHYKIPENLTNFIILEYQKTSECDKALDNCQFNTESPGVEVTSRFLWFKTGDKQKLPVKSVDAPLLGFDDTRLISDTSLNEMISASDTLDDQILVLHRATCLSDFGTRIRFLAASQLETALGGMFPHVKAFPFGSSVNGFGKTGCDLDLILRFSRDQQKAAAHSRLVFHTKNSLSNVRSQTQRQMETIGDILHLFLPGVSHVRKILQARVPIIKFKHECLDLDVDLSMSNLTGLYMSELLYLFGEIDERVKPLTFCIRKWAAASSLTNSSPGRWISNFSLTLLVLFFLQRLEKPILPPMKLLVNSATKDDIRIADDNISCTFLRNLQRLNFKRENSDSLSYLLVQFFEFYSQFDFGSRAVCLVEGKPIQKPDHAAVWIVNPFETLLNVSKNMSFEELERFKLEVRNAAWMLESSHEKSDEPSWGLLNLFKTNKQAIVRPQMFFKSRLVDVSDIFGEPGTNDEKKSEITFKNSRTKSEVSDIREATKRQIMKLELMKMKGKRR